MLSYTLDSVGYIVLFAFFSLASYYCCLAKSVLFEKILYVSLAILGCYFYTSAENASIDLAMYLSQFNSLGDYADFKWGYSFFALMKAIRFVSEADVAYITGSVLFAISILSVGIYLISPRYYRPLCLLFFFLNFNFYDLITNTYRQCVASCLILIAIYFIYNRKYFFGAFFLFVSLGFHWSAMLVLFLTLLSHFMPTKKRFTLAMMIGIIVFSVYAIVVGHGISLSIISNEYIDTVFQIFNVNINEKLQAYIGHDMSLGAKFSDNSVLARTRYLIDGILLSLVSIIFLGLGKGGATENGNLHKYIMLYGLLSIYNLVLIDMMWFFRNSYWAFFIMPLLMVMYLNFWEKNIKVGTISNKLRIGLTISIYFSFSVLTLWRHPNLTLNHIQFLNW